MRTTVVPGREVGGTIEAAWRAAVAGRPELSSPYFDIEYLRCIASVRDDVFVEVVEDAGQVIALLPFQRRAGRIGGPVGGPMSDFQGLLSVAGGEVEPSWLVRQAGLLLLQFDHWVAEQPEFTAHRTALAPSATIDLEGGIERYLARRSDMGRQTAARLRHKARRLARGLGPLRFEWRVRDPEVLDRVLAWKTEQSRRTGSAELFTRPWARAALEAIHAADSPSFGGVLSALWAGDRLVAGHMGMRSRTVLHYWFPAYDRAYSEYSAGLLLRWEIMQGAEAQGVLRIDLGKGEQPYKERMKTHDVLVAEGRVASSATLARAITGAGDGARWIRRSPLSGPARQLNRVVRRVRRYLRYRCRPPSRGPDRRASAPRPAR